MTTPARIEEVVGPALRAAGYRTEPIQAPGGWMLAGRRRDFRIRWFLTQLKTTVAVTTVEHATPEVVRQFTAEAFVVAKRVKGGLPNGLQSGCGCVAVLVAGSVDPAAAALAQSMPTREWFQGISTFALLDASTGHVYVYDGRVLIGWVYVRFLTKQRDLVVAAARAALGPS